jgi:UDP-N-acetyl-D-glucosamine dehydrogenase
MNALADGHSFLHATLLTRLTDRTARVGVIGLGYVGLPLARALVLKAGFPVLGFDTDPGKVERLNGGGTYIQHIPPETVGAMRAGERFAATGDFGRLSECDVVVICVPTPLTPQREPDLSYVTSTAREIARHGRPGQLVVLESTTYPGTTRDVLAPLFRDHDHRIDETLFLAFSPEREDPGNLQFETTTIPKIVGAEGPRGLELAAAFYRSVVAEVVPVSSSSVAEAVKITENIFRSVNIALVNELKLVFAAMDIDVWEVIEGAKTKPFGYMPFYPGPGLGGHCIPIDPFYLTWKAREYETPTRFIELAGEINTAMPAYVVERLARALDARLGRGLRDARVLVLGIAYKKNVDDSRESPGLRLIELLEARGARVDYHDPHIPVLPPTRRHADLAGRPSVAPEPGYAASYDAALIATDHDGVDYADIVRSCALVVDTRNVCARLGIGGANIVKA